MAQQQVFISYAWGGESEKVADEIEAVLTSKGIRLIRDKTDLGFKGLIREFMEEIGQGNFVVLVISDKYLKSKNCMFELLEAAKKGEFHSRVFPVVLPDADIYDPVVLIDYYNYWQRKIDELNGKIKTISNLSDTRKVLEELDLYTDIRGAIDDLAGKLSNMNTLTVDIMRERHYQPLVEALQKQSGTEQDLPTQPSAPVKKEGKVLYHIPGMMQVEKWTRCTVRLAWEELILTEGLKIPEEERVVEAIRLGNVMQVSLKEGRDGQNFEIKALNHEEQFILEDEFTEWLYDVKPLTVGNFILILRVTLVQIIEGKERKKDIVLERDVMTEAVVPQALARFETAEKGLIAPIIEREGAAPQDLETFSKSMKPKLKDLQELAKEAEKPEDFPITSNHPSSPDTSETPPSPRISNRGATPYSPEPSPPKQKDSQPTKPSSSAPIPPSSPEPSPYTQTAPQGKMTTLRKIMPYAASLAILVVVGALFIPKFNFQASEDYTASVPPNNSSEEKMLVALSLMSFTYSGDSINEVLLFKVDSEKLDSIALLNPGNFSLEVFPVSDTLNLNLIPIREFTIQEIQDSVKKVADRPAMIGNQSVDRSQLQINPESQIIRTKPHRLDSARAIILQRKRIPNEN